MDYAKTLNLPKTDFPMRANLPKREPDIIEFWEKNDIYEKSLKRREGGPKFILHDGPPYANGDIHLGHTLNKILKDIVIKYKTMKGYYAPYVPGWDTHGLPIELQAIKHFGIDRKKVSPVEFRKICKEFALKYMNAQRDQFKRLGVRGDWEHPYLTLNPEFEAKQIEIFGEMAKKGYIYKGLKPVYWCPSCETALAEAEIEYEDIKSTTVYVKFPVVDDLGKFKGKVDDLSRTYFLIWTTTIWTLPANMAICLGPDYEYSLVKAKDETYIIATELVEEVMKVSGIEEYEIVDRIMGIEMEYMKAKHPFYDRESLIIVGPHVTLDQGTGCVHTAPGHGQEDFDIGMKYGLEVLNPVDDRGYMTKEAGKFAGMYYEDSNKAILEELVERGALLAKTTIKHSYPHCWRCKNPVIFRATEQWFASVKGFREEAIKAVKDVEWIPRWGEERITNMISERQDWCISRQRIWGVPIPIFYCKDCKREIINDETINAVASLFREKGSDAWFAMEAEDILPDGYRCPYCQSSSFRKETDIMDVWFDSGSSHMAVLETTPGLSWPADMYLEGNDQYRGWFQSSLLTSVAVRGKAPYKTVLTHGFVVDGKGRKMSKSLGNGIDPMDVIKRYGADILRLWVVSADYRVDVRMSMDILKQLSEIYRKIRNTARFLLGNLYDFDYSKDAVSDNELLEIDRWAMMRLQKLIDRVTRAYERYEYHVIYHAIHNFCVVDMSNFYLDIIKDRLYCCRADSVERRAAQTVIYKVLNALVKMLAPVLSFTCEEIWQHMGDCREGEAESIQLVDFPVVEEKYLDRALEERWDRIITVRGEVTRVLEGARGEKLIGNSLEAAVRLYADGDLYEFLKGIEKDLPALFIVSQVEVLPLEEADDSSVEGAQIQNLKVSVIRAAGKKCERCWNYSETVGQNSAHPTICSRCAAVLE